MRLAVNRTDVDGHDTRRETSTLPPEALLKRVNRRTRSPNRDLAATRVGLQVFSKKQLLAGCGTISIAQMTRVWVRLELSVWFVSIKVGGSCTTGRKVFRRLAPVQLPASGSYRDPIGRFWIALAMR